MSGFKSPQEMGEDTPIFNEKQAYEMQKGINKVLWESNSNVEVKQEQTKKSGFCQ